VSKLIKSATDPLNYYKRGESATFRDNLGNEFPVTVWWFYGKSGRTVMISGLIYGQHGTIVVLRTMIRKG
jgi:hypothetical protein